MVVETSALVSIMQEEEGFELLLMKLADAGSRSLCAASYLEACMVLTRGRGVGAVTELDIFLHDALIKIVPLNVEHAKTAVQAFLTYGRGNHPAKLNYGDCMSYALAKSLGERLLFIGNDFSQTDIPAA